ncbi:ATP-binding protein [Streptomyces albidus (ex Kaewkla and Franco 2022)]|uniref:ATP-binding protein n=1 Tax=Streptomyces albidus (ex Kaewkla and Franco 2022) TaxID=722709 RepID=UPI0015EF40A5|nr:AAA family ATPase [Streptomyces albidus (ex Kaewkla and Franco 2022)]
MELDEDLEVTLPGRRLYLQVKTRQDAIGWSDIVGAVAQFRQIRMEHQEGRRSGTPALIVVSNVPPGPNLKVKMGQPDWPDDVYLLWPGGPPAQDGWLPAPSQDLDGMLQWCTTEAGRVPFASLKAQTLVWKLAAQVQYACTGAHDQTFQAADLSALCERFVEELRTLPEVPDSYLPHDYEPELIGEQRVRLIVGYSGVGKSSWAAKAAEECPFPVTYCDVDSASVEAVAEAMARELAARHLDNPADTPLPNGTSLELLRAVHLRLAAVPKRPVVVLDNIHRLAIDDIRTLIDALNAVQLVLLAQPWPDQLTFEAYMSVSAESLPGWSTDTVTAAFVTEGCGLDYPSAERIRRLTGGLPLFVLQAARLTRIAYGSDAKDFCDAFEAQTHTLASAQDRILERSWERLTTTAKTIAGLLALAEVPITREELQQLTEAAELTNSSSANARALRELVGYGLLQSFGGGYLKCHDAVLSFAASFGGELDRGKTDQVLRTLCQILEEHHDFARVSRWLMLLPRTGQVNTLLDLTEQEGFYESGYPPGLWVILAEISEDLGQDTAMRFAAHSALSSRTCGNGDFDAFAHHVEAMEQLLDAGHSEFGLRDKILVAARKIRLLGEGGDRAGVKLVFDEAIEQVPRPSRFDRSLRYEYAAALFYLGDYEVSISVVESVKQSYVTHLGLPSDYAQLSVDDLKAHIAQGNASSDDYKRLADCIAAYVRTCRKMGNLDSGERAWAHPAMKLFLATGAWRQAIDSGQDVVDFILFEVGDPYEALRMINSTLLPITAEYNLPDLIVDLRSFRALVVAFTGDIAAGRMEIRALEAYEMTSDQALDLNGRSQLIEQLAAQQSPLAHEE